MNKMITLLTDFGTADGFVGGMKGFIKSFNPEVELVDISHDIPPFDIRSAAFSLLNYASTFPSETVHLVVVDPGVGGERKPLVIRWNNYWLVGPDNGVFSLLLKEGPYQAYVIRRQKLPVTSPSSTFHGRDIFGPAAALLAGGKEVNRFCTKINRISVHPSLSCQQKKSVFVCPALAIDHFGNIITPFHKSELQRLKKSINTIRIKSRTINHVSSYYAQEQPGHIMALWNSLGLLEIACNQGNARKEIGFDLNTDKVYIYYDLNGM